MTKAVTNLAIAVRAYAVKSQKPKPKKWQGQKSQLGFSDYRLIFDTETTTDETQRLRFGCYQVREGESLKKSGIFYDPGAMSDSEVRLLNEYCSKKRLEAITREAFVEKVFFQYAYDLSALCVGLNLPFDLSRIALGQNTTKNKSMRGGFTLLLSDKRHRARLLVRHLSSRSALIQFTIPGKQRTAKSKRKQGHITPYHRGYFVDVRTLAGAILSGSWSLEGLAKHLNTEHQKQKTDEHGETLTEQYLDYAVADTQTTWDCFRILEQTYKRYNLTQKPITKIYSEASLGKAYLQQMGVKPWDDMQKDFPQELLGAIMSTYYGGRSEVRVRRQIVRTLYCDFLSMYPTTSVLMKLWQFVIAQGIEWRDATQETQGLLENITVADLQKSEMWPLLTTIVKVQPDDDLFPVRAKYDGVQYSIGLNYLTAQQPVWYTLADCVVSKIHKGHAPKVIEAIRFTPSGIQPDLTPINIAGNPDYCIDPRSDDFYKRLIELRMDVKSRLKNCSSEENERLESEQLALKICANATCYGIFVELNVTEQNKATEVACFGSANPFATTVANTEEPGKYFHPLLATVLTGASRLMLALAERLAEERGMTWAYCDTDSLSFVKPNDMTEDEFRTLTQEVIDWFVPLNPYVTLSGKKQSSLLKIEDQNFRVGSNESEPLYCFAVSAKRNVLFNIGQDGQLIIRKASGHGLGHLLPPYGERDAPDNIPIPIVPLKELGVDRWQHDLWYLIVEAALGNNPMQVLLDDLPGFNKPAVSRYAATTPALLKWFKKYNRGKSYAEQVKPFNFMMAFPARSGFFANSSGVISSGKARQPKDVSDSLRIVAPYFTDPAEGAIHCFDRNTGTAICVDRLKSYKEALLQYHLHPEAKFDKGNWIDFGITERKHVVACAVEHIGKEANRWEEQWHLGFNTEAQVVYGIGEEDIKAQWQLTLRECRSYPLRRLAKESELDVAVVSRLVSGKMAQPSKETLIKLSVGLEALKLKESEKRQRIEVIITTAKAKCQTMSVRQLSELADIDYTCLTRVLTGKRKPSVDCLDKLEAACSI